MERGRIFELDVLRGFAILLVMGVHVPAYPIWNTFGCFGVDLFFVLSGFLISSLLFGEYQRTGGIRLARFFARRALKLYPSFYLLLVLTLIYCIGWKFPFTMRGLMGELVLTQNYIGSIWGHTWSLAVEEHFYLLLPLVLAIMIGRNPRAADPFRAIPWVFLGTAAVCLVLRLLNAERYPEFAHRVAYEPSHLRFDSLLYGVCLSYFHHFRPELLRRLMDDPWRFVITLASILMLAPAIIFPPEDRFVYTYGFTLLYLSFGTVLLLALYKPKNMKAPKPGRATRAIAWMGGYSYTLYLWHVPMAQVFGALAGRFPGVNQYVLHAIYFAISILAGVAASKLLEQPVLRLRERLFPTAAAPRETRQALAA